MFHYAPAFQPVQNLLSSFYPSPTLSNPTPPQTGSDLLSRRTAGALGISVPPLSSAGGGSSDEDQYGPLSPVYSDLPALVHVAFIVALGADDGHILSLRLLPAEALRADIGPLSLGWRLAWPRMASNLVLHLLEVAAFSSVGLPAFEPLLAKVSLYRFKIQDLSPASKIDVTILCVLGARATSHSELFGVAGVDAVNPACSSELASLVGRRREEVCQNLMELALDLCDDHSVAIDACTLESLAALVQLFTAEEAWEGQHRHILHLAHTLYVERLHACTTADEVKHLKLQAGVALFEHDCISSSTANRRCEITQVTDYIDSLIQLPSLSAPLFLPYYADPPHSHPLSFDDHSDSFLAAICWVGGLQRMFSEILDQPHHSQQGDPILHLIPALWDQVDHVRTTIQRRQRALSELADAGADAAAIEGQVFAGMRVDLRLVELLMVVHGFLLGLGGRSREMRTLVELSELRMRKCLKLLSYCANVYLASTKGRPLLYHLVVQLELLPNWTSLVVQRVGETGGPREKEYEVSEQELDWLTSAMRVAQFYTPLASQRIQELLVARRTLSPPLSPSSRLNPVRLETIQEITFYPSPPLASKPLAQRPQVPVFDLSTYLARSAKTGFESSGIGDVEEESWADEKEPVRYYAGENFEDGGDWMEQAVGGFGESV